jgi:hypothetical protein
MFGRLQVTIHVSLYPYTVQDHFVRPCVKPSQLSMGNVCEDRTIAAWLPGVKHDDIVSKIWIGNSVR